MQNHQVRLVRQDDLPAGTDWALVEVDGRMVAFLTPAALCERGLEEAWAAYRLLAAPAPPKPRPARATFGTHGYGQLAAVGFAQKAAV